MDRGEVRGRTVMRLGVKATPSLQSPDPWVFTADANAPKTTESAEGSSHQGDRSVVLRQKAQVVHPFFSVGFYSTLQHLVQVWVGWV